MSFDVPQLLRLIEAAHNKARATPATRKSASLMRQWFKLASFFAHHMTLRYDAIRKVRSDTPEHARCVKLGNGGLTEALRFYAPKEWLTPEITSPTVQQSMTAIMSVMGMEQSAADANKWERREEFDGIVGRDDFDAVFKCMCEFRTYIKLRCCNGGK